MRQNFVIFFTLFGVLILGLWGQYEWSPEQFHHQFPLVLYQVVMLFALEGEWTLGADLPWQLDIARFLAPLVSIAGVLFVLTRGAWVTLTNFFIRFGKDHIVVVGLDEKAWQFARSCSQTHRVIIVDRDEDNPLTQRARNAGMLVVTGDYRDRQVMSSANIERARHIVFFCSNDVLSVELALKTREYLRRLPEGERRRARLHLHSDTTDVASHLKHYSRLYDDQKTAEVDFFSVHELSARLLLKNYPPEVFADIFGQRRVHIVLYGFTRLAKHIVTEAVRVCHFLNGSKLLFSIIDKGANDRLDTLLHLDPGLKHLCDINCVNVSGRFDLELSQMSDEFLQSVTEHVICLDNDGSNFELALALRSNLLSRRGCNAPIHVRLQHSSGLAELLDAAEGEPEIPDGIYPFGMLKDVLYYENVLSDRLDELAQTLHTDNRRRWQDITTQRRPQACKIEWSALPEAERDAHRLQADHLDAKLRAVRCHYRRGQANQLQFSDAEAEALARMEYARIRAHMTSDTSHAGSVVADPWDGIDKFERQEIINSILRTPAILQSKPGWRIERACHIGLACPRCYRANVPHHRLGDKFASALGSLSEKHGNKHLVLVSSLATEVERYLSRIALDSHGLALRVLLPLPFELYQTDFNAESLDEFKRLIGRAELYLEVPTRFGSLETLASNPDGSPNEARNRQYALAGAYIAQICDEMIVIGNEDTETGADAVKDVLAWRSNKRLPPDLRNDADFFLRPSIGAPIIIRDAASAQVKTSA